MKKILFVLSATILLAAGCNGASQPTAPVSQTNAVQSSNQPSSPDNSTLGQPTTNNTNPGSLTCESVTPLSQLKSIVGDTNLMLATSLYGDANDAQTAKVVCVYSNYDVKNPSSAPKNGAPIIGVNVAVYNFDQNAYNFGKSENKSGVSDTSGLGSEGYSYLNNSAYFIVSSNKKYMFTVNLNYVVTGFAPDYKPTVEYDKQTQYAQTVVKLVDSSLNSY